MGRGPGGGRASRESALLLARIAVFGLLAALSVLHAAAAAAPDASVQKQKLHQPDYTLYKRG
jgi:hypothetical protein